MNIARLNFSHSDFAYHSEIISRIRKAASMTGHRITLMADLPGPKMRIGKLANEPVELRAGSFFTLTTESIVGNVERVSTSFERLPHSVKMGDRLFLNDGYIQLKVTAVENNEVHCRVLVGGELRSNKGLNLPGINLGIGAFTHRDRECLAFALEAGVDAISQSFVESAADVHAVRRAALELGYQPFIIAKVERSNALHHIDDIIDAADGIMIARGDLGVEVPIEEIAVVQKDVMRRCNRKAKPVITATQMLESMTHYRRPTRAEATDVANAIFDGTDAVMLSGESAMGRFPVESVQMLAAIASSAESHRVPLSGRDVLSPSDKVLPGHLIALAVESTLEFAHPAAIFVPTRSGATARSISRFRPATWLIAVSPEEKTCQGLQFSYGVFPVYEKPDPSDWNSFIREWHCACPFSDNLVVLTAGPSPENPDTNFRMELIELTH